jgi:hypothetical protein
MACVDSLGWGLADTSRAQVREVTEVDQNILENPAHYLRGGASSEH